MFFLVQKLQDMLHLYLSLLSQMTVCTPVCTESLMSVPILFPFSLLYLFTSWKFI